MFTQAIISLLCCKGNYLRTTKESQLGARPLPGMRPNWNRDFQSRSLIYCLNWQPGLFLLILGKFNFSSIGNFLVNYLKLWKLLGKESLKESSNAIFLAVIDTTFHLIWHKDFVFRINVKCTTNIIGKILLNWEKTLIWHWEWGLISAPWEP